MATVISAGRTETVEVRRNLVPNPAFTVGTAGWAFSGGGGLTGTVTTGAFAAAAGWTRYARCTFTASGTWSRFASDSFPVDAGAAYTLSGWTRGVPSVASELRLVIYWYRFDGSQIEQTVSPSLSVTGSFTRDSVTGVAPDEAVTAKVGFGRNTGASGDYYDVAGILFEKSPTLRDWFDGSLPAAPPLSYAWTGAANNSASVERLTREAQIIPEVVDGFEANREARTIVHTILGRSDPDITFRPLGMRAGTLSLVFASGASAAAAENILLSQQVFTLRDSAVPEVGMSFVVADGELVTRLDDGTRKAWIVEVPYREVAV